MNDFTPSSGNVFADLGLEQADIRLVKARIANLRLLTQSPNAD